MLGRKSAFGPSVLEGNAINSYGVGIRNPHVASFFFPSEKRCFRIRYDTVRRAVAQVCASLVNTPAKGCTTCTVKHRDSKTRWTKQQTLFLYLCVFFLCF